MNAQQTNERARERLSFFLSSILVQTEANILLLYYGNEAASMHALITLFVIAIYTKTFLLLQLMHSLLRPKEMDFGFDYSSPVR